MKNRTEIIKTMTDVQYFYCKLQKKKYVFHRAEYRNSSMFAQEKMLPKSNME